MAALTQNKQMPDFHCGPQKKKKVSKSFKGSKTAL